MLSHCFSPLNTLWEPLTFSSHLLAPPILYCNSATLSSSSETEKPGPQLCLAHMQQSVQNKSCFCPSEESNSNIQFVLATISITTSRGLSGCASLSSPTHLYLCRSSVHWEVDTSSGFLELCN